MTFQKLAVSLIVLALVLSVISIVLNVYVLKFADQKNTEDKEFSYSNQGNVQFVVEGNPEIGVSSG